MNYIKHLTKFYDLIISDERLSSTHVSLYLALFQVWNLNRFRNPFLINRNEIIQLSKIGSLNTYHRCMKDLHEFKYICYFPSKNPVVGSKVNMYNFDTSDSTSFNTSSNTSENTSDHISYDTSQVQEPADHLCKIDTSDDTSLKPLYKHNKPLNKPGENINGNFTPNNEKKTIPEEGEVKEFFTQESFPAVEGEKFYLHFRSIGWKIGGKAPVDDWKAAAKKWMLNLPEKTVSRFLNFKKDKNYGEPL